MTALAIDISNYTDTLTSTTLDAWKQAGVELVICQAVNPPAGFPAGVTRTQLQACIDAGLTVDAYIWLWFDLSEADISAKLALLDGFPIRKLWLDVEDTASIKYNQATCEAKVTAALALCDAYTTTSASPTGVYSGRWFWTDPRYLGNTTTFSDRELWDANYDNVADAALGYVAYGGWAAPSIKQFRGTSSLSGVGGVDLNVLSLAEQGQLQPVPTEPPTCDWGWVAKKSMIVGLAGELKTVADQIRAEANKKGGPKKTTLLPLADAVGQRADKILS